MNSILKYKLEFGLLLAPILVLLSLRLFGFDGLYGQDSYEYLRYTIKIKEFFLTGVHPGYFFWPKGYPLVAGIFSLILPANIATQLVSLISLYLTVYFTHKIIKSLNSNSSNSIIFLIAALLLSPYILRASMNTMSDMLAICCLTGSVFYGLKYEKTQSFNSIFLSVFLGVFSVFTRYAAIIPVLIVFIWILYYWMKRIKLSHLLVLIVPLILIPIHFYFETNSSGFLKHSLVQAWHVSNIFKNEFFSAGGHSKHLIPNVLYAFSPFYHPGFFLLNGFMVLLILRKLPTYIKKEQALLVVIIVLYALFLAGMPVQNSRILMLTYPLVLVLLFPAFDVSMQRFEKFKFVILILLIAIQLLLFSRAMMPTYDLNKQEKELAVQMTKFQNQILYCFDIDVALKGRGLDFDYRNLWMEEYSTFDKGALILFNEEKLKDQWDGKNPMINWNNLTKNHQLTLIKELDAGWELYRIEN